MKALSPSELKEIQIRILQEVDEICYRIGINYSIAYGTLIGAVRHRGFIPWDDDIDIVMPLSDYNRLVEYYKNNQTRYKIACYELEGDKYKKLQAKVYDPLTILIDHNSKTSGVGVNIDIFILVNIGDSIEDAVKNYKRIRFYVECIVASNWIRFEINYKKNILYNTARFLFFILSRLIPYDYLYKKLLDKLNSAKFHGGYVYSLGSPYRILDIHEQGLFEKYCAMPFESIMVNATIEYDSYLKKIYGDYLRIPPKEEQVPQHDYLSYYK